MRCSCREDTSPRDEKGSAPKGLIREKTKIDPVLDVKVTNHLDMELRVRSIPYKTELNLG